MGTWSRRHTQTQVQSHRLRRKPGAHHRLLFGPSIPSCLHETMQHFDRGADPQREGGGSLVRFGLLQRPLRILFRRRAGKGQSAASESKDHSSLTCQKLQWAKLPGWLRTGPLGNRLITSFLPTPASTRGALLAIPPTYTQQKAHPRRGKRHTTLDLIPGESVTCRPLSPHSVAT
ncbi:hypothetical protein LZ30DRAFT_67371 [Colletotrichum cereale]|nr:hypothetical protein LZ30DRAFT_67371 [Colletotrichum cereale]